ncbi:MAG: 2-oxo acid dehydrogenase subunit E2 [Bradymonadaceae bacterium]|nr:2-oxo acid dehydrogenase subunit E2 [Lujinxingiaceae bacterium]
MAKKYWSRSKRASSWRKISVGIWGKPADPTVYGYECLDADDLLDYLDEVSEASGEKVTLTTFLVKILADTFAAYPDLNSIVIGNRVLRRENVDIFVQVAIANEGDGQADLSGVKLRDVDKMDFVAIAKKLRSRATQVRTGQDAEMEQTKSMVDKVPPMLMPWMLKIVDFLTYAVPFELDAIGVRSDPFGSAMVTNVGQFDIRQGFAPLVPASRCPLVCMPCAVRDYAFVYDKQVVVRRGLNCSFTLDHRIFDGYQIGQIVREFRNRVNHPRDYYPPADHWREPSQVQAANTDAPVAKAKAAGKRTPEAAAPSGSTSS